MEKEQLHELTDEELLVEKKKLKQAKIINATLIGFLAGIVMVGVTAWTSAKGSLGFLIPMAFPIFLIYKLIKNLKKHPELEAVLKERNLY